MVSYNTTPQAQGEFGQFQEAQALLCEMTQWGLPANRVTYDEFLTVLVVAKDSRGIWACLTIWELPDWRQIQPPALTYRNLARGTAVLTASCEETAQPWSTTG